MTFFFIWKPSNSWCTLYHHVYINRSITNLNSFEQDRVTYKLTFSKTNDEKTHYSNRAVGRMNWGRANRPAEQKEKQVTEIMNDVSASALITSACFFLNLLPLSWQYPVPWALTFTVQHQPKGTELHNPPSTQSHMSSLTEKVRWEWSGKMTQNAKSIHNNPPSWYHTLATLWQKNGTKMAQKSHQKHAGLNTIKGLISGSYHYSQPPGSELTLLCGFDQ